MNDFKQQWTYMSSLVPGYVDQYTLRGVRKRNKRLLKQLEKASSQAETDRVNALLIDNNRPLAMYVAWRFAKGRGWSREKTMDAYQECCVFLTEQVRKTKPEGDFAPSHFQVHIYYYMLGHLDCMYNYKTVENHSVFVPFEEEEYPLETDATLNKEFIREYFEYATRYVPDRDRRIFLDYYLGDDEVYGDTIPNLETIAFYYDLTKEGVRQIVNKTIRKLRKVVKYHMDMGLIHPEDFTSQKNGQVTLPKIHSLS